MTFQAPKSVPQIVICFPEGEVDSVPSLLAATHEFCRLGYHVTVLAREREGYLRPPAHGGVTYLWHPARKYLPNWLDIAARAVRWLLGSLRLRWRGEVTCVIGVDQSGLIWARWLNSVLGAHLVYWSLEITPRAELVNARERRRKAMEQHAARSVSTLVVQDEERESLLRKSAVDLPGVPTVIVPNSPGGDGAKRRSGYLRDRLGIPENKRIVLNSGSVAVWACLLELAESTIDWPDDWVLVIHSCRSTGRDPYAARVRQAVHPGRVYLSEEPLPSDRYPDLVRSADVGVAFYREQPGHSTSQQNLRHMGLSSGKAASYLREGVPLIYTAGGLFHSTLQTYRCGERVEDPARTVDAIARLLADYEMRCAGAVECFNTRLRVDGLFSRLLDVAGGVTDEATRGASSAPPLTPVGPVVPHADKDNDRCG